MLGLDSAGPFELLLSDLYTEGTSRKNDLGSRQQRCHREDCSNSRKSGAYHSTGAAKFHIRQHQTFPKNDRTWVCINSGRRPFSTSFKSTYPYTKHSHHTLHHMDSDCNNLRHRSRPHELRKSNMLTNIEEWYTCAILIASLIAVVAFSASISHNIYITKKYFNEILRTAESCPNLHSEIWTLSMLGFSRKMWASNQLYETLFNPKMLATGEISLKEIENFSPHLLRLLARDKFLFNLSLVAFLALGSLTPLKP